jgi:hypothetical protein
METIISVPFYAELIRCVLHGGPFPDIERSVSLILGSAAQESAFMYTQQIGGGPAKGYLQIEGPTEVSLWVDYLAYNPEISAFVTSRCGHGGPDEVALEYDMIYGILLARTLYFWRDSERLPAVEDIEGQASVYKTYYNTTYGAATEEQFLDSYATYVSPYYPKPRSPSHG